MIKISLDLLHLKSYNIYISNTSHAPCREKLKMRN